MAVYWALLFVRFFSPGTPTTWTLTVTGVPIGGVVVSGICASADVPAFVWLIVLVGVIGLGPPVLATSTFTSSSSFWPWLENLTATVGLEPDGIRLSAGDGCIVTPPIAT